MNIKPLSKNIFARLKPTENKIGAIHVPDKIVAHEPAEVEVLAVGSEVKHVRVGMKLLVAPSISRRPRINGDCVMFVEDHDNIIVGEVE